MHWDLVSAVVSWDFLHLEIIQERLEREYNLDLVTTAPGVIYKVYKTNGDVIELTNPSNLPDPSEIEYMEEPMVKAEIMVTTEFIGAIMDLCQETTRHICMAWNISRRTRAVLKYDLPLNEIIYDFFDALKSRSRGYASFDYELKGYVTIGACEAGYSDQQGRSGCTFLYCTCRYCL